MNQKIIDEIISIMGEQSTLKAVCGISDKGPIDEVIHAKKIERARWFGLLEKDSLTLTDLGKLFAVKFFLDLADNIGEEGYREDFNSVEKEDKLDELDNDDWDDEIDDDDWDEEDWEDDEDDDDYGPRRGRRGNRRN